MLGKLMRFGAATAALAAVCAAAAVAQQDNPFRWSGTLPSGQTLEVRAISGDVHVELAPGGTAEVVARKEGKASDFDDVQVRVVKSGEGVTICTVYYPDKNSEGCDGGRPGWFHRSIHVSVDYTVRLPAGVALKTRTVSGDVVARDVRSDVDAASVSGEVHISTTGKASASTVSGDIDVGMADLDWTSLRFHSVSGDVTLRLPGALATGVDVTSVSGDFHSDFPVTLQGEGHQWVGSHVRGTIGGGGDRTLKVSTVSGDVRLVKM